MKKWFFTGLLGGVIMLAAGMATGQIFQAFAPSLEAEYHNASLFRPWSDPLMMLYFIHPLLLGIILAWIWEQTKVIIRGDSDLKKGINFGLIVWLASSVPGMLMSYASFPLSFMIVLSWSLGGLIELLCLGILFSKMLKGQSNKDDHVKIN